MTTETPTNSKADGPAKPGSEAGSAGAESLDAILAEFEARKTGTKAAPDHSGVLKDLAPVVEFAKTEMATRAKGQFEKDLKAAIDFVKEAEEAKNVPDEVVRGLLEVKGSQDQSFVEAFKNRQQDAKTWATKLAEAKGDAVKVLKGLNGGGDRIASDVAAAKAAVSGTSSPPPGDAASLDPAKAFRMSEHEWRAHLEAEIAKAQR